MDGHAPRHDVRCGCRRCDAHGCLIAQVVDTEVRRNLLGMRNAFHRHDAVDILVLQSRIGNCRFASFELNREIRAVRLLEAPERRFTDSHDANLIFQ
jgi:hypothetical protein